MTTLGDFAVTFLFACFALGACIVGAGCAEGGMPRFSVFFYGLAFFYGILGILPWVY